MAAGEPGGALERAAAALGPFAGEVGARRPGARGAARAALQALGEAGGSGGGAPPAVRARALLLEGWARRLAAGGRHSAEAEEALVRAVKLDPEGVEAWNLLGSELWDKGDLDCARHCLEYSGRLRPNGEGLRQLSILRRQLAKREGGAGGGEGQPHRKAVEQSVEEAKQAVGLDIADGHSWYVLGNAYLALYFTDVAAGLGVLQKSLKAYQNAERNGAPEEADLCFNRGTVCRYLNRYQDALDSFKEAQGLDANLPCAAQIRGLVHTLSQLTTLTQAKCQLKPHKIATLASAIAEACAGLGKERAAARTVESLEEGTNRGAALNCKILQSLSDESDVPLFFVAIDSAGACFALMVFGLKHSAIKQNAVLTLLDPVLHSVAVRHEGKELAFQALRMEGESAEKKILIGGKPLVGASLAPVMSSTLFNQGNAAQGLPGSAQ